MVEWSTACPDWERRIVAGESLVPFPPLFPEEARSALEQFNSLRVVDAPGSPTMGEVSRSWVTDFVGSIFGSYDADSGRRLISEFFMLISKKNGKSTDASGIMMTAMLRNWRTSEELLILAPTIEIANNSFGPARDMVKADEELSDLMHVQDHIRTITHRQTGAALKVVAADNETVGGKKAGCVLIDELWLFGKRPGAENMLREACGGLASRPEGFVIYLSTQSDEPPAGVFKQKLQYARDVRDGRLVDRKFLPVLYEYPTAMLKKNEHRKPKNFYVTNPNLGVSVDREFLDREFVKAENAGEASMRGFLAKHLNVEIGLALMADRWPGAMFWEGQARPPLTLPLLIERSEVITVGIDGGGLDDLLGLAVVGREKVTGTWLAWTHAWAHPSVLELRKSEATKLEGFRDDGDMTFAEHIRENLPELGEVVMTIETSGKLDKVGMDPAKVAALLTGLIAAGVPKEKIVAVRQGWTLDGAIVATEVRLADGTLEHGGQRLMDWCVGNARAETRANSMLITKGASGRAKIDPLMALFDAVELMANDPEAPKEKQYQMFFV